MTNQLDLGKAFPSLWETIRERGVPLQKVTFCGWPHAKSAVWRLEYASGPPQILKRLKNRSAFAREFRAYTQWLPQLKNWAQAQDILFPCLLCCQEKPNFGLLLSELSGEPACLQDLNLPAKLHLHRLAGTLLARFHSLPHDDGDLPLEAAYGQRTEACRTLATQLNESRADRICRELEEALPLLKGIRRVPCHRDFTSRNWLWSENQQLGLIDFEHSGPDLYLSDMERLASQDWLDLPELEAEFWEGYGTQPSEEHQQLLRLLARFSCLRQILWARRRGDERWLLLGEKALKRLQQLS